MPGPMYVPVLPTRPHPVAAYRDLPPSVQAAVAPVWTLPPRGGMVGPELTAAVRKDIAAVSRVQRYRSAWLDAPFALEAHVGAIAGALRRCWSLTSLRPVTGPGRPVALQTLAMSAAEESGDGLGIRVRMLGEWDDEITSSVRELVLRSGPLTRLDLLLDLGSVHADRPDAAKEAVRALDALVPLAPWRTTAIVTGGFPELTDSAWEDGWREEDRPDWDAWRDIWHSGRAYLPMLSYGDYGALPARAVATVPSAGRGGPSWGALRYTTSRAFVLARTLTRGEGREDVNRRAARRLVGLEEYRGPGCSPGEAWLRDCAEGLGSVGLGNHGVWNRVGNVQHMAYVVKCLGARSRN